MNAGALSAAPGLKTQTTIGVRMDAVTECPMGGRVSREAVVRSMSNQLWWPNRLDLSILHQNSPLADPMAKGFNYAEAFKNLDLKAVKADIFALMTASQEWWPAD